MTTSNYAKAKGRSSNSRPFFQWPKQVTNSEQYWSLGAWEVKLLNDLGAMYIGNNNGDLCAAWTIMSKRGWNSKGTLAKAIKRTIDTGFIVVTRQGGRNKPTLYALSFHPINECKGKLDVKPTVKPPNTWKKN